MQRSALAIQVPGVRDPSRGIPRTPWGFLIHTTGGGVTDKAKRTGKSPIQVAIETYIDSQNGGNGYYWGGPHYVIDHDGTIYQVAPDDIETAHCGAPGVREHYLDGTWRQICRSEVVERWTAAWPGVKHPYALFPSRTPNMDYVGCEMIPIGDGFGGAPHMPGGKFTTAQHTAVTDLAQNVAERNGFPADWAHGGRLCGHEDVDPISRHDAGGGWDPGYLRITPAFAFAEVRAALRASPAATSPTS